MAYCMFVTVARLAEVGSVVVDGSLLEALTHDWISAEAIAAKRTIRNSRAMLLNELENGKLISIRLTSHLMDARQAY